ncbi:MAG: hypothetical protein QNJ81_09560 [Acidimicrobiia bacterium]|nr:hypothetical protein [Acidimicrobiia bacterium]
MKRTVEKLKSFYQPHLEPGEEIRQISNATAGGTGSKVGYGAAIGALLGWLFAINVDSALLPPFVLGALGGGVGGYLLALRFARRPEGPGSIHIELVLTTRRLFTVRRYASLRREVLREYPLAEIKSAEGRRYPIGQYQRLTVELSDGTSTSFVLEQPLDLPLNRDPASG